MHMDFNSNPKNKYILHNTVLNESNTERDLGVLINNALNWDDNIKAAISKANQILAWVARNVITRDKSVMVSIYKSLIRPHLEYCAQIWSPVAEHGNWGTILEIESVQRRFTRMIEGLGMDSYSQRLESIHLTTLAERRLRGDLIETFKIVNNIVAYGSSVFRISRSGYNLVSKQYDSNNSKINKLYRSFLPNRVQTYWNKLPTHVKNSTSVEQFKVHLELYKKQSINDINGNFWEVSNIVLDKIEGKNYLKNKELHNRYLMKNPKIAKKLFINTM